MVESFDEVRQLEMLREESAVALSDADFLSGGGQIFYAVDTSEIHAFVYPITEVSKVRFPAAMRRDQRLGFHELVLELLFFGQDRTLIMLPPYLREFESFAGSISNQEITRSVQILTQARSDAERIRNDPVLLDIKACAERFERLTPELVERTIGFLEAEAPSLLLLAREEEWHPVKRLDNLVENVHFSMLEEILGGRLSPHDLDREFVDKVDQVIAKRRRGRRAESRFDAMALGYLKAANQRFARQRKRVVLVTRSQSMPNALDDLARMRVAGFDRTHMHLRSPWAFALTLLWSHVPGDALEVRLGGIDQYLIAVQQLMRWQRGGQGGVPGRAKSNVSSSGGATSVDPGLMEFMGQWSRAESLALFKKLASSDRPAGLPAELARILSFLESDETVTDAIERRLVATTDQLRLSFEERGERVRMGWSRKPTPLILERTETATAPLGKHFVLRSPPERSIFSLQFYSPALERLLEETRASTDLAFARVLAESRLVCAYERRLALAYLVAMDMSWQLARSYCNLAVEAPHEEGEPPRHEARYFRALCRRMDAQLDATSVRLSLSDLDDAIRLKRDARGSSEYEDPRYLNERASQIHRFWTTNDQKSEETSIPSLVTAIELWTKALESLRDDDRLRLAILNNLTYHYITYHQEDAMQDGLSFYRQMRLQMHAMHLSTKKLPARTRHTMAWARWVFAKDLGTKPAAVLKLLEGIREEPDISDGERDILDRQIAEVRAAS